MSYIKKKVEEYVTNVIKREGKTGCTLMYNTFTTVSKMSMDIFAYTLVEVVCIDRIDNICHFKEILTLIGPTNVVQLII